jgi:cardiolipin synthase
MADKLSLGILRTTGILFLVQIALFLSFSLPAGFFGEYGSIFFPVSAAFHLLLLGMLFLFKQDFVKEATGERLEGVNLANCITLFRVSTLPTLLFLVLAARDYRIRYPLLVLVVIVFASDFVDGYVSRKAGEVTRVGRMMDSASDYSLLIVLTIVFYYFILIPAWFFWLVVARLGIQLVFMGILIAGRKRIDPKTTILGKVGVAAIMILYAIEVLRLIFGLERGPVFGALEWITGGVIVAGIVDKSVFFIGECRMGADRAGRTP